MADRKVRYVLEVDYEGESVTARAADDLREVDDAAKEASEGLEQAGGGFSKLQASVVTMQSALGIAEQGLQAIAGAAEFAYQTLSEGSALVDARGDFDDLAASIGTTADALEGDLKSAAGGLVTDAQLIGQAGELMALGLGLSADEITQLTGLAAELDWNFKALTDTLNTGSSRGLKELGLNIADVKQKAAELADAGMAADEAFRWAIIEAGEEKLERVGRKSEEASGQLQQLEVIAANVQDEFAMGAAEGFAAALDMIADSAPAAGAALEATARGISYYGTELLALAGISVFGTTIEALIEKGMELEAQEKRLIQLQEFMAISAQKDADMYGGLGDELENLAAGVTMSTEAVDGGLSAWNDYIHAQDIMSAAAAMAGENAYYLAGALESQAEAAERAEAAVGAAAEVQAAWAAYTTEMTAQGGDYFTQFSQGAEGVWDLEDAIYDAADAAGAGIKPLSDLAVQYGMLEQEAADAATSQAQQQIVIDNIAQAARDGKIAWEDYRETVENALDFLKNGYPDPVVRENPYAQQLADMNGIDPAEVPGIVDLPANLELQLSVNYQPVLDAVDAAKGAVEGFAESDPKVTMFMDIDEVETKAGRATELIEGIPEVKNVRIDVTATGMEILEELRAMGALP